MLDALSATPLNWRVAITASAIVCTLMLRIALFSLFGVFPGHYIFYPAIVISTLFCGVPGGAAAVAIFVLFVSITLSGAYPSGANEHRPFPLPVDFLIDSAAYIALARMGSLLALARQAGDRLFRVNAEQLGHFVEQAPVAMAMFDRDMRYIAVSGRWRDDYDLKSDVVGKSHFDVFPEISDEWKKVYQRALAGENVRCEQDLFVRLDGATHWLRWEVRPWRFARGGIGGVVIFSEDISERVLIQQALHENERRLNAIFETAMDAIVTIDRGGVILSANPAARDIFGYGSEEMIGRRVEMLMPEHFAAKHDAFIVSYIQTGVKKIIGQRRVVSGRRSNGETFPLELTVSEASFNNDLLFVGIMRDLSPIEEERRRVNRLREELAHVSRLNDMGEMVAGLAHEVGQPVAAILNFAAVYRRALATTGKAPDADLIGKIEEQARRATEILKRLRGFIEKRSPERQLAAVDDLIKDSLKLVSLRSRPRIVRTPLPAEVASARVFVDPIQIEQVLVNLLRNADDAMIETEAPEIVIETSLVEPDRIRVTVADNGAGVDKEAVAELFDPFFSTKHFGMGVGLSISKSIVESHGGAIFYRENAPQGSIFEFELPINIGGEGGAEVASPEALVSAAP